MARNRGARRVERAAIWAFVPVVATAPFCVLALAVLWTPLRVVFDMPFWWVGAAFAGCGLLLFVRPFQVLVLTPVLGARRPEPLEELQISGAWVDVARANDLPLDRYVLRVLPSTELNAFACGGHLVVVTSYAATELSPMQLQGVLAHELSHHLGLHTVAITVTHWLSVPVILLARVGFFLENVARAAADTFGRRSPVVDGLGQLLAGLIRSLSWVFTAGLRASDALGNYFGHELEFEADRRAVRMGFGPGLASALRHVLAQGSGGRPIGWRARLAATHPAALTRIARIEALRRHPSGIVDR